MFVFLWPVTLPGKHDSLSLSSEVAQCSSYESPIHVLCHHTSSRGWLTCERRFRAALTEGERLFLHRYKKISTNTTVGASVANTAHGAPPSFLQWGVMGYLEPGLCVWESGWERDWESCRLKHNTKTTEADTVVGDMSVQIQINGAWLHMWHRHTHDFLLIPTVGTEALLWRADKDKISTSSDAASGLCDSSFSPQVVSLLQCLWW